MDKIILAILDIFINALNNVPITKELKKQVDDINPDELGMFSEMIKVVQGCSEYNLPINLSYEILGTIFDKETVKLLLEKEK